MTAVEIREARPTELAAVADLLRRRDGRPHDLAAVGTAVLGLAPERFRAWIAFVDGTPAGLTALYLRPLRWAGRVVPSGYWAHLFVDEPYRRRLLYPRLVAAMLDAARQSRLEAVITATRRAEVAAAHLRLGFCEVGQRAVLARPLRPFAVVAKRWGWPRVASLTRPLDALCAAVLAPRPGRAAAGTEEPDLDSSAATLVELADRLGADRTGQIWDIEAWRRRFAGTLDGAAYRCLAAPDERGWRAALIYRGAERQGVRLGVVLDLLCSSPAAVGAASGLLRQAAHRLARDGAEALLALEASEVAPARALALAGFRPSAERYRLLLWPPQLAAAAPAAATGSNWRFSFADHDAF